MRLLLILLLSSLRLAAQVTPFGFSDVAARAGMQQTGIPQVFAVLTNITGFTNLAWWVADNISGANTNVNGKVLVWPDYFTNHWDLTNKAAASTLPTISNNWAAVNGHAMVHFDKTAVQLLNNFIYTNNQPHEVMMVVLYHDQGTYAAEIFESVNSLHRQNASVGNTTKTMAIFGGTLAGNTLAITNKWIVLDVLFNGVNSGYFTNNVSAKGVIDAGANTMQGFTLGAAYTSLQPAPIDVAEVVTFGTSLGTVDAVGVFSVAAARQQAYSSLTNKYNIAP